MQKGENALSRLQRGSGGGGKPFNKSLAEKYASKKHHHKI
jgi:hypothetical protein